MNGHRLEMFHVQIFVFLQSLDTSELDEVGLIQKPEFVTHPERYFSEKPARGKRGSALPPLATTVESEYCSVLFILMREIIENHLNIY